MTTPLTLSSEDAEALFAALQEKLGIIVPEYQRSLFALRLPRLLSALRLDSAQAFIGLLNDDSTAASSIGKQILDVLSCYSMGWDIGSELKCLLKDFLFDKIDDDARIWLVGCAQGEAAWSLAMELDDYEQQSKRSSHITIVATDSFKEDVEKAESARYNELELAGLGEALRKRYLSPSDNGEAMLIRDRLRQRVEFKQCELIPHANGTGCDYLGAFDMILCTNVLAYFPLAAKEQVLRLLASMIKRGGVLIPDTQQQMPPDCNLERVEHPSGIFYRKH